MKEFGRRNSFFAESSALARMSPVQACRFNLVKLKKSVNNQFDMINASDEAIISIAKIVLEKYQEAIGESTKVLLKTILSIGSLKEVCSEKLIENFFTDTIVNMRNTAYGRKFDEKKEFYSQVVDKNNDGDNGNDKFVKDQVGAVLRTYLHIEKNLGLMKSQYEQIEERLLSLERAGTIVQASPSKFDDHSGCN